MNKPAKAQEVLKDKFKANIPKVRDICTKVEEQLKGWEISENDQNDILISIDEAITNIIIHGYGPNTHANKEIELEIVKENHSITVAITDTGKYFNPDDVPIPNIKDNIKNGKRGGFGVFLMKSLMDSVHCVRRDNTNIMKMEKKIL